jgi:hypothetical protein
MSKPIVVVGGGKGGVGKSTVSIGVIDTLLAHGENVQLIESDTSNPDVWKMYRNEIETCLINLDDANGWIDLVNVCEGNPESVIVLNTAARNNGGVAAYGHTLNSTLAALKRDLITIWVINRQRDSLELLNQYMAALTGSRIHVMRNGYFGGEQKFQFYNGSNLRTQVENAGGKSLTFPDLADRVSDDLYSKRLSIGAAMQTLPLGNRAELARWRREVHRVVCEAIHA